MKADNEPGDGPIIPQLRASDTSALLRIAIESIADGFAIYDDNDRLVLCNSNYRQLVHDIDDYVIPGASFEEMHRRALARGHFPEAVGREEEWLAQLLEEHRNPKGPREHRLSDGRWMLVTKRQKPNGWVASLRVDITALKEAQGETTQARAHLAAIVNSTDDAVISTTLDGTVTSWNNSAQRIFGYTAAEMLGRPLLRLAAPGRESEMIEILGRIREGDRVDHYETQRRHKDGTILDISLTESPVYDETGALVGASKVSRDITASKKAEAALRETEARLEALNSELLHVSRLSAMGQMAAMITHELNQPLTAVGNYMEAATALLGRAETPVERVQDILSRAGNQAVRAGQIIQRLRGFVSRGENEKRIEPVSPLIQEAAELAAVGTKHRGMDIRIDDRAGDSAIAADKIQLQQVLFNLLRNAAEAVADGERRQIVLIGEAADNTVKLSVIDNGPGLPQEVAERLFEPFVTTKKAGMGVGLSICKAIVDAHDGRIWAEPNPEGGTIFRIEVPLADAD